jgi:hypothetical protein
VSGQIAPGSGLLRDDWLAKTAAWMWLRVPLRVVRRLRFLDGVAGDGHFIAANPVVAVSLAVGCRAAGFVVGARHWGYELLVTESMFLMTTLLALGALSGHLALLALVGFALGDFFVGTTVWSYTVVTTGELLGSQGAPTGSDGVLDSGLVAGLWRVRLPMLIVYLVLGIGALAVPRLARAVATGTLRSVEVPYQLEWLVASSVYVVTIWVAVTGWAASLPVLIRPFFTWRDPVLDTLGTLTRPWSIRRPLDRSWSPPPLSVRSHARSWLS